MKSFQWSKRLHFVQKWKSRLKIAVMWTRHWMSFNSSNWTCQALNISHALSPSFFNERILCCHFIVLNFQFSSKTTHTQSLAGQRTTTKKKIMKLWNIKGKKYLKILTLLLIWNPLVLFCRMKLMREQKTRKKNYLNEYFIEFIEQNQRKKFYKINFGAGFIILFVFFFTFIFLVFFLFLLICDNYDIKKPFCNWWMTNNNNNSCIFHDIGTFFILFILIWFCSFYFMSRNCTNKLINNR